MQKSKEYWEWVAKVWKENDLRNQRIKVEKIDNPRDMTEEKKFFDLE